jgi:peptide/nickel transport system permease protein
MRYFLRRFGFFVATLWAAVTLNFLIPRLQPGDPARAMATRLAGQNKQVTPEQLHALQLMIGAPTGNLVQQYGDYLDNWCTAGSGSPTAAFRPRSSS